MTSGVACGEALSRLIELTLGNEPDAAEELAETRKQIVEALGASGLVDAAAVIGNFQRMVRIADGTGIPLDKPAAIISADIRKTLNLDEFGSAHLTPTIGALGRWLGRHFAPALIKRLSKKNQSSSNPQAS